MQSRQWMFRKAINMIPRSKMNEMKFYSWQCLTFKLDSQIHSIDLVFPSETDMKKLLKYLIYRLKIFNGDRGSAVPMLKMMNRQDLIKKEDPTNYDI